MSQNVTLDAVREKWPRAGKVLADLLSSKDRQHSSFFISAPSGHRGKVDMRYDLLFLSYEIRLSYEVKVSWGQ